MTVRVVDNRSGAPGQPGQNVTPFDVLLIGTTTGRVITFPYNPESWREQHSPQWQDRNIPGRGAPILDWKRNAPGTLSIDYVLQIDDKAQAASFIVNLKSAAIAVDPVSFEPERWQFVAGTFDFLGHIGPVSVNYVRTDANGDPDITEIAIEMTQNEKGLR